MKNIFRITTQDEFGNIDFDFYSLKDVNNWMNDKPKDKTEELKKQAILHFQKLSE
jgi:hypothetical protein